MNILLATKLKNMITKANTSGDMLKFEIKNISRNCVKTGCSGFVTNLRTGIIVYINTEMMDLAHTSGPILYRTAAHNKDYRGGQNHFSKVENIADRVVKMLENGY